MKIFILYKLTKNSGLNKRNFVSVFGLYLFQGIFSARLGQNMLIRKMFLKKCLHFVTFYKADTLYRCEFVFYFFLYILVFFTGIHLRATQNMFNALKSKPLSFTLLLLRWKNNEQQAFGT